MQIWKPCDKKWRHTDVITKNNRTTMGKCGPPRNQTNYISLERYWWELSKNTLFIEFEPLCQKLWVFLSNFGIFLRCPLTKYGHATWPKKQTSKNFYFVLILHLISGKVTKFRAENSILEVIRPKTSRGGRGGGKHPPSAFRVKIDLILTMLFNVYFLYRKSWTFWVTDKELPKAGQE